MTPPFPASVPVAKTSAQAVWSLVLGILSITCLWLLGSIPAIILGILAVKNIDRSGGTLKGRGIGVAGIVTGSVGILAGLVSVGMVAAIAMPAYNGIQIKAKQTRQMNQIKEIVVACHYHATEENGAFPESLEALVEAGHLGGDDDPQPISTSKGVFLYRPGLTGTSPDEEVFIASPEVMGNQRVVGQVDGVVRIVAEEDFHADYAHLFPHQ
jgi:hypothetical protein